MRGLTAAALALGAAALLTACGSGTKTVSVAGAPSESPGASTASAPTHTARTHSTASAPPSTSTSPPPSTTRTGTEPAFTHTESGGEAANAAAAVVRAHGYTPEDASQYHPDQTLRVLVGTRAGSGDGYGQQAFFFVDGRYIGTDASAPSAKLRVVSQSDTEVTLAYPLYRPHDAPCCPSGGQANVSFELNDGKLSPLSTIPPTSSTSGLSRQ